ncbi:phospholipase D-like domain-containing protein [Salinisphaera orenii]|uniref:phospholipase D-like domain-containing protein n=1 Tax=Salinisphaera orenii TaxID=856731 RepID=UPI000F47147C|nr:phospholipase D-like domain-containing protein [Salinisphaera halophila]
MSAVYNNASCDIYIGRGAGKKLLKDISSARSNVRIISPYLSPSLVSHLVDRYYDGVKVQLVTSDVIEDYYGSYEKNIHKLISQNRNTDIDAQDKRNKLIRIKKILSLSGATLFFIAALTAYFFPDIMLLYAVIPISFIAVARHLLVIKIKNKIIYHYSYQQLFPFKVFRSPERNEHGNTFIHSKVYIIDDEVAYLGSLNFTVSGTKSNYETRVRVTDEKALQVIIDECEKLFNTRGLPVRNIHEWGRELYAEPIN